MTQPGPRSGWSWRWPKPIWSVVAAAVLSGPALAQTALLSQPPNRVDAHLSDAKLQSSLVSPVPTGACAAENFVLSAKTIIAEIRIWGIYFPGGIAPATDNFTVIVRSDTAGLPGAALSSQRNVPATRQVTGERVDGITEHAYTLMLDSAHWAPGVYWVEICNDTTGSAASFYWEFGVADPLRGVPGAAFVLTAPPGNGWLALDAGSDRQDLAIEITARPVATAVPTLSALGMAIVSGLLAVGGTFLARSRCATQIDAG